MSVLKDNMDKWSAYAKALFRLLQAKQLSLHAMGLVYTSLLSLVPLLAISFSLFKAFGVHNAIEPMILEWLKPLGDKGQMVAENLIGFVDNANISILGSVGLFFLLFTVISMVQKCELAFNQVWGLTRGKGTLEKLTSYFSVIMIGPLLIFIALGVTASASNHQWVQALVAIEPLGTLYLMLTKAVPYLLVILTFTFVYLFVPNTKVKLKAALVGGVVAGCLWQLSGIGFTRFVAHSGNYDALYSSFAVLILFLIWLYISWLVLLFGSLVTLVIQRPSVVDNFNQHTKRNLSAFDMALMILLQSYQRCEHHYQGVDEDTLNSLQGMTSQAKEDVLKVLLDNGYLVFTALPNKAYYPILSPEDCALAKLWQLFNEAAPHNQSGIGALFPVVQKSVHQPVLSQLEKMTMRTLLDKITG